MAVTAAPAHAAVVLPTAYPGAVQTVPASEGPRQWPLKPTNTLNLDSSVLVIPRAATSLHGRAC